jgi:hypothetical protein
MRKTLTAAAVLVATLATLATIAVASPASATQRFQINAIEAKGSNTESFVLTPMTTGAVQSDKGTIAYCCWTTRHVVVAGETLEINDPHVTINGANGTLELRNRIVWVDLPDGWSLFTGTWKVVGGTGAYARLTGQGHVAGATTPTGSHKVSYFGFLGPK